jgi:hypothetical protein
MIEAIIFVLTLAIFGAIMYFYRIKEPKPPKPERMQYHGPGPNPLHPPGTVKCPYCKGTKFFEGPQGGMSTNILCANNECRHWFNYTPMPTGEYLLDDLNRVEARRDDTGSQK